MKLLVAGLPLGILLPISVACADDGLVLQAVREGAPPAAIRQLLEQGHPIGARDGLGKTPLHVASAQGNDAVVAVLLEGQADPYADDIAGLSPVYAAALGRRLTTLETMVRLGVSLDRPNGHHRRTALAQMAYEGDRAMMEALLRMGASPNVKDRDGMAPLHHAIRRHADPGGAAQVLLQYGADPNAQARDGRSPLHLLVQRHLKDLKALTALLAGGADADLQDNEGSTPLHALASHGWSQAAEMGAFAVLLKHARRRDVKDKNGQTPLHLACQFGPNPAVRMLLEAGADPNARDNLRGLPMMYAVTLGHPETVASLLAFRADLSQVDAHGSTMLDLAVRLGKTRVAQLLRQWGARPSGAP